MESGAKELGAVIVAVLVIVAMIVLAKTVIIPAIKTKMETEINKIDSSATGYVQMVEIPTYTV